MQAPVPIAIGKRGEILDRRIDGLLEHRLALVDLSRCPFRISRPNEFRSVHEFESVQAGAELYIVAIHPFERRRPGIENLDGLLGMRLVAGDAPHQRVLIRRVAVERHLRIVLAILRIADH